MPVERRGEAFLQPDDVEDGVVLTITAKPRLVETRWTDKDGNPKTRYRISVRLPGGQEKPTTLNATSSNALLDGFGPNEEDWLKRKIIVEKRFQKVRGEDKHVLYFKPSGEPLKKQETLPPTKPEKLTIDEVRKQTAGWPKQQVDDYIDHLKSSGKLEGF